MSVTYGFYNSLNGDRVYNASHFGDLFDGIISDGVFMSVGNRFYVKPASTGLGVVVGTGKAWFNGTWTINDEELTLPLSAADSNYSRIDAVVIEVNKLIATRENSIKIVSGTPATNPLKPNLSNGDGVYQHPVAYITVPANATSISQSNIELLQGTSDCPYVTGPASSIDASAMLAQWKAQWNEFINGSETEFDTWFASMVATLDEDVAGRLANRIYAVEQSLTPPSVAKTVTIIDQKVDPDANRRQGYYLLGNTVYVDFTCIPNSNIEGLTYSAIAGGFPPPLFGEAVIPIYVEDPMSRALVISAMIKGDMRTEGRAVLYVESNVSIRAYEGIWHFGGSYVGDPDFIAGL